MNEFYDKNGNKMCKYYSNSFDKIPVYNGISDKIDHFEEIEHTYCNYFKERRPCGCGGLKEFCKFLSLKEKENG